MVRSEVWTGILLLVFGIIMTIIGFFFLDFLQIEASKSNSIRLQRIDILINLSGLLIVMGILLFFGGSIFLAYGLVER